ncbi:hydrolase [Aliidiomarina taiwanensis]|uniref:Hydrolase n=1 Tax=Aliidiomarina taiwanensis TaxID=946228 RepID=A0A432X952_9GAMM|nr:isochorismatase family protein [Aliidiomarina taiwanensis]RUO43955.1 hydrolase [Aliidiomarina taiwanensis]
MLNKENTGLILVDIQGKLARLVDNSDAFIANCVKLVKGAKALNLPILWLEQTPDKLGGTVEELAELLEELQPIPKYTFDACAEPLFTQAVQTAVRRNWLVCGIEAHICVYQTAAHLKKLGHNVHLVVDCISARDPANIQLAVTKLQSLGVTLTGLEMCLYEVVHDSRASEFKDILGLIK